MNTRKEKQVAPYVEICAIYRSPCFPVSCPSDFASSSKVPEIDNPTPPTNIVKIGHADAYLLMAHVTKNGKLWGHLTSLIFLLSCYIDYTASS